MNLTENLNFSAVCILIDSWKGFGLERFTDFEDPNDCFGNFCTIIFGSFPLNNIGIDR